MLDNYKAVVHLKSGRVIKTTVSKDERYKAIHFSSDTIWKFISGNKNYFVSGDNVEYIEIKGVK